MEPSDFDKAKNLLLRYVSGRMRTENQAYQYLEAKGISREQSEQAVLFCRQYNYLNDREYAVCYIRSALQYKHQGTYKIVAKLREKGCREVDIDAALAEVLEDIDENLVMRQLFEKRLGHLDLSDARERQKAVRFLQGRGFSLDRIFRLIGAARSSP